MYTRAGETWSHQAYVKASNTSPGDWFGDSIALSDDGKTMAVGAPNEDSNATGIDGDQANDAAIDAGAVYVFRRTADSWAQEAYVKSSNLGPGDLFGAAVRLSADGNVMAVAGLLEDSRATGVGGDQADDLAPDAGAVYVFRRAGAAWSQQAYVKAPNTHADNRFGTIALSADASTMAVGAFLESSHSAGVGGDQADLSAPGAGAVYLY
ncbi:MAG: FG-GAP repeat protein [Nannocystis sp.]|uniref:FG-GAP repeat protein n=1 Tax=Nannocystis sp. TaxID=1962667 RepID=UPI0024241BE2|nr:FG-GAP repeat protein [Nannocystis sp.]MBK9755867.1 FG-GAP repeat protein [Nannocystis sp.]